MQIDVEADGGGSRVVLSGALDIYGAAALRERLLELLQRGAVRLELGGVEDIDSAGLQVLMAAKAQARQFGVEFSLGGHSAALLQTLQLCQLLGYFGDPVVELATQEAA
jgi:anti-anti-sigma factor